MITEDVLRVRNRLISANVAEYGDRAVNIVWALPEQSAAAEAKRAAILREAAAGLAWSAKGTKPHWGTLSPGCRICTEGQWSCLFINGKCNCRCFYCPTTQNDISVPTTNRVTFPAAGDYAQYVRRLGFGGTSISGGEPLLTFERTIEYIERVRRELGDDFHIWLYTNGTLVNRERLHALKSAGLNEIRFDISAVGYDLSKPEMAAGIIECVTVEIPAIPEDADRLAALLPAMAAAGVNHLNLHQLRLTPHNFDHLLRRCYTFLHGESVTVLESELTALALLQAASAQGLGLPVNYCAFVYKRRYQQAATRRRNAGDILKGWESVTESGFIRRLALTGAPETLAHVAGRLDRHDSARQHWTINTKQDRLQFHADLWPFIDFNAGRLLISYFEAVLDAAISYRCAYKEVRLDSGRKIYIEKRPIRVDAPVTTAQRAWFEAQVLEVPPSQSSPTAVAPEDLFSFERISEGLQDYF